jgi:hypothetical protein
MDGIAIKTTGFDFLEKYREELSAAAFKNSMKKAVKAGADVIEPELRAQAPKKHGTLRIAITQKIRGYTKSGTAVAIIGPASRFRMAEPPRGKIEQPSKIAHLVEFGHRIVKGGKLEKNVKGTNGKIYYYAAKGAPQVLGSVPGIPYTQITWRRAGKRAMMSMKDVAYTQLVLAAKRAERKAQKARWIA